MSTINEMKVLVQSVEGHTNWKYKVIVPPCGGDIKHSPGSILRIKVLFH